MRGRSAAARRIGVDERARRARRARAAVGGYAAGRTIAQMEVEIPVLEAEARTQRALVEWNIVQCSRWGCGQVTEKDARATRLATSGPAISREDKAALLKQIDVYKVAARRAVPGSYELWCVAGVVEAQARGDGHDEYHGGGARQEVV